MFFQKLPKRLQEAIKALTIDEVFQKRFGTDEVLNKLDEEKFDLAQCYNELCTCANIPIVIENQQFNPVTLFQYVYLWCIDSPLVKENNKPITELDLDIFFYTLDHSITTNAVTLAEQAAGELRRKQLEINKAYEIANTLIHIAFAPLKMFPVIR